MAIIFKKNVFCISIFFMIFGLFDFSSIQAVDKYFVNGGNTSDGNNWSLSTGGAGGAGVPTSGDNVYFDQNLAATVNGTLTCNNLTYTTVFSIAVDNNIVVNGSLLMTSNGNWSRSTGYVKCFGDVNISGANMQANIEFLGDDTTLTLGTNMRISTPTLNKNVGKKLTISKTAYLNSYYADWIITEGILALGSFNLGGLGDFTMNGGSVTSTTGILTQARYFLDNCTFDPFKAISSTTSNSTIFTDTASVSLMPSGGDFEFKGGNHWRITQAFTEFPHLIFNKCTTCTQSGTFYAKDVTILNNSKWGTGYISGDVVSSGYNSAGGTHTFIGSGDQQVSGNVSFGTLQFNKSGGGTVTFNNNIRIAKCKVIALGGGVDFGTVETHILATGSHLFSADWVVTGLEFYSLKLQIATTGSAQMGTTIIKNNFTIIQTSALSGTIYVGGNFTNTDTTIGGSSEIILNGTGDQLFNQVAGTLSNGKIKVEKSSGSVKLGSNVSITNTLGAFEVHSGTFDLNGFDFSHGGSLSIYDKITLKGTETVTLNGVASNVSVNFTLSATSSTVTYYGAGTANVTNLTDSFYSITFGASKTHEFATGVGNGITVAGTLGSNGTAGTRSILRSVLDAGVDWEITLTGTSALTDKVSVKRSNALNPAGQNVLANGSLSFGNNTNWVGLYSVTAFTWTGATNSDFDEDTNWYGLTAPTSTADVVFNGYSNVNCTINATSSVTGFLIESSYTGTVTQQADLEFTIGANGFEQNGGTFKGGNSLIVVDGTFVLNAGATFESTTGELNLGAAITMAASTFIHKSGLVKVDSNLNFDFDLNDNVLSDFILDPGGSRRMTLSSDMIVEGLLTIQDIYFLDGGIIKVRNNISIDSDNIRGTTLFEIDGGGAQEIISNVVDGRMLAIKINKGSGTLTLKSDVILNGGFEYVQGGLDQNDFLINFNHGTTSMVFSVTSGTYEFDDLKFKTGSNGTVTFVDKLTVNGTLSVLNLSTANGADINVKGDLEIADNDIDGTSVFVFNGAGNQTITDLDGNSPIPKTKINKATGSLTFLSDVEFRGDFEYLQGNLDQNGFKFILRRGGSSSSTSITSNGYEFDDFSLDTGLGGTTTLIDDLIINGTFEIVNSLRLNSSTLHIKGDFKSSDVDVDGTSALILDGAGDQNITFTVAMTDFPARNLVINKASGSVILKSNLILSQANQDLSVTAGTLDLAGFNLTIGDQLTIDDGLKLLGTETVTVNGAVSNVSGNFTLNTSTSMVTYYGSGKANVTNLTDSFYSLYFGASKTHEFATGVGNGITVAGTLGSNATASTRSILQSVADASVDWEITLTGTSTLADKVFVKRSNALNPAGKNVLATGSVDLGNNTNWIGLITPTAFTWTGATNSDFDDDTNWYGLNAPGVNDTAIFSGSFNVNCSINANIDVKGVDIQAGYSGTITQVTGKSVAVGSTGLSMAGGTFLGGDAAITIKGELAISGGNFRATSVDLKLYSLSNTGGTYTHNSGRLYFNNSTSGTTTKNIDVNSSITLFDLKISGTGNWAGDSLYYSIGSGDTLVVLNDFEMFVDNVDLEILELRVGTVEVRGDISVGVNANGGSATIKINGDTTQKYSGTTGFLPIVQLDTTGTLEAEAGQASFRSVGFVLTTGTFSAPTGEFMCRGNFTQVGGTYAHNSGTLSLTRPIGWANTITTNIDVNGSLSLFNLKYTGFGGSATETHTIIIASGDTIVVNGDFTITREAINLDRINTTGGTIELKGDLIAEALCYGGSTLVKISGNAAQVYSGSAIAFPGIEVNTTGSFSPKIGTTTFSSRDFTLIQGTFDAPSGKFIVRDNFVVSGGTFNHNNGEIVFSPFIGWASTSTRSIDVLSSIDFYDLTLSGLGGSSTETSVFNIQGADSLVVLNNFVIESEKIHPASVNRIIVNGGLLDLQGNVDFGSIGYGGTTPITFSGTNDQSVSYTSGTVPGGKYQITKPSGKVLLATSLDLKTTGQNLEVVDGELDIAGNALTVKGAFTVYDRLSLKGTETVTVGGVASNVSPNFTLSASSSTVTYYGSGIANVTNLTDSFYSLYFGASKIHEFTTGNGNGITVEGTLGSNGSSGARSVLQSLANANIDWELTLNGTSTLANKVSVKRSDARTGTAVLATGSLDLGNNQNWVGLSPEPTITSITSSTANGSYKAGDTIDVTVNFSVGITMVGTMSVTLDTGSVIEIGSVNNATSASGVYTVIGGQTSGDLTATNISMTGTATNSFLQNLVVVLPGTNIDDGHDLVIDTDVPTFVSILSTTNSGVYKAGDSITIQVNFDEDVVLAGGNLVVALSSGGSVAIIPFTGTSSTGTYTVLASENANPLSATGVSLSAGTLTDVAGNTVSLTSLPGTNINPSKNIIVDTIAPVIQSGALGALNAFVDVTFSEPVYSNANGTGGLSVTDFDLTLVTNGGSVAGVVITGVMTTVGSPSVGGESTLRLSLSVTGAVTGVETIAVTPKANEIYDLVGNSAASSTTTGAINLFDLNGPSVVSLASVTTDGFYKAGQKIEIKMTFSEVVIIAGSPLLLVETGTSDQNAAYKSGSGSSEIIFEYSIQAGDLSLDLDAVSTTSLSLNSGSIKDGSGNDATLILPTPGLANSLGDNSAIVIDTTAPIILAGALGDDNAYVDITFSEGVYRVGGVAPLTADGFSVTFNQNGGIATGVTIVDVQKVDGNNLVGGETVIRVLLKTAGVALGVETLKIVGDPNVIVDIANNPLLPSSSGIITLVSQGTVPKVLNVTALNEDGVYGTNDLLTLEVTFSEIVFVTGLPFIELETGDVDRSATYAAGNGTDTLTFYFRIREGDAASDLDYTSASAFVSAVGKIKSTLGVPVNATLAEPSESSSLGANKNIQIETERPIITRIQTIALDGTYGIDAVVPLTINFSRIVTLSKGNLNIRLNSGAVLLIDHLAGYDLKVDYIISKGEQADDLSIVSISLDDGAVLIDSAGLAVDLTMPVPLFKDEHQIKIEALAADYLITAIANSGGSLSPLGATPVVAGQDQGFTIIASEGFHIDEIIIDGNQEDASGSYTFTNVNDNHTIEVVFVEDKVSYLVVAESSTGGSVSPLGASAVEPNSDLLMVAMPETGYHVSDVLVDGVSVGAVGSFTFTNISADHNFKVLFAKDAVSYVITTNSIGSGVISSEGNITIEHGLDQLFSFVPTVGYHVGDVKVDGISKGALSEYIFSNVLSSHTLMVEFEKDAANYLVLSSVSNGGNVDPIGSQLVVSGASLLLTFTAEPGYHLIDVLVDGVSQGVINSIALNNIQKDMTVNGIFAKNQTSYLVLLNVPFEKEQVLIELQKSNETIDLTSLGTSSLLQTENANIVISVNEGYHLTDIKINGISKGALPSIALSQITSNQAIEVLLEKDQSEYIIATSIVGQGSVSPSQAMTVLSGADQSLVFTPAEGFHILAVMIDGESVGAVTNVFFEDVVSNHSVQVIIVKDQDSYRIGSSVIGSGVISPTGEVTIEPGGSSFYAITADENYQLVDLIVNGKYQSIDLSDSYAFVNVQSHQSIIAVFDLIKEVYQVNVSHNAGGSVNLVGNITVNHGEELVVTMMPEVGFHVKDILLNGVSKGPRTSLILKRVIFDNKIEVVFEADAASYSIKVNSQLNGILKPTGETIVNVGDSHLVTIVPNSGFRVLDVQVDGISQGPLTNYLFTHINSNHEIQATFVASEKEFTVLAIYNGVGTLDPSGFIGVSKGEDLVITISADNESKIVDVIIDGVSQGPIQNVTFNNVTQDHLLEVFFSESILEKEPGKNTNTSSSGGGGCSYHQGANSANLWSLLLMLFLTIAFAKYSKK